MIPVDLYGKQILWFSLETWRKTIALGAAGTHTGRRGNLQKNRAGKKWGKLERGEPKGRERIKKSVIDHIMR